MALPLVPERSLDTEERRRLIAERINGILRFDFDDSRTRTNAEIQAGVRPVNPAYAPGDVRRYGYVADGIDDDTDTGTDNATAIQNCINSNIVTALPDGIALFSGSITLPQGRTIRGKGPRKTTLRQVSTGTTAGVILGDIVTADISEGAHRISDLCLKVAANAGAHGIRIGDGATAVNASMLDFSNFRLWSQHEETLTTAPYDTVTNQRGIYIQSASSAVFFANLRNVEIRSFDIGIDAAGSSVSANEWSFTACWLLGSRIAVRLTNASTWNLTGVTVESGVENARALYTLGPVSNINWHGGRWELTEADSYGVEGDVTTTGQNWRFSGITVLIDGDGGGIPGRKWTGTVPNDFVFSGYDVTPEPFTVIPNVATAMRLPSALKIGGLNLGNALITLNRDLDGAPAVIAVAADGVLDVGGTNGVTLLVNSVDTLQVDASAVAGNTRLLVYDVDNNTLERVSVGAADSGGGGFKVLRIPN